ncbi:hypothetical protein U9M48_015908 [Paspalum notatum var. saurae]|uniref:Uncharacterized protein n=1 Tax=Paspalum notatum var. saurae TaxID=547442 RepID=A0AAQ3T4Z8_PASNO
MDFAAGSGGGGGSRGRGEPARWLEIAGRLLAARDLVGCKRLAERAVEADPHLSGADELLAVADVLLASQRLLPSGRPDPVAVLQLQPGPDPAAVRRSFHRLSQLVSSPRNPRPAADTALHFVQEAFADISNNASADPPPAPALPLPPLPLPLLLLLLLLGTPRPRPMPMRSGRHAPTAAMCQSAACRRAFVATEIPTAPPIVPGTDMYYCAWGFFPMGFPKAADLTTNWKPFCPMFPGNSQFPPQQAPVGTANVDAQNVEVNVPSKNVEDNGGPVNANSTPANVQPPDRSVVSGPAAAGASRGRMKKTTARKKVGVVPSRYTSSGMESEMEPSVLGSDSLNGNAGIGQTVGTREININEVAKPSDGATMLNFGGDEDIGFDLDVDPTDAILGNLQHLPFLREDDNARRIGFYVSTD